MYGQSSSQELIESDLSIVMYHHALSIRSSYRRTRVDLGSKLHSVELVTVLVP